MPLLEGNGLRAWKYALREKSAAPRCLTRARTVRKGIRVATAARSSSKTLRVVTDFPMRAASGSGASWDMVA